MRKLVLTIIYVRENLYLQWTCLSNLTIGVQSQKLKVEEKKQVLKIILLLGYPHSPKKIK